MRTLGTQHLFAAVTVIASSMALTLALLTAVSMVQ